MQQSSDNLHKHQEGQTLKPFKDPAKIPPQFLGIPSGLNEIPFLSPIQAESAQSTELYAQEFSMLQPATLNTNGIINADLAVGIRSVYGEEHFERIKEHQIKSMELERKRSEYTLSHAETQAQHRMNLENRASDRLDRGQWMGYSIHIISLIAAGIFVYLQQYLLAMIIVGGSGSAGLVSTLLTGSKKLNKKADSKKEKDQADS